MKMEVMSVKRVLCLILALGMLLSLAACRTEPVPTEPSENLQSQPTQSQPTEGSEPTSPATKPTDPPEPPDPDALVYTLTQADVDEFYRLLEECETMALNSTDLDAIDALSDTLDEQYEVLNAQCSIANVLHYSDMSNETLEKQYLDCVDICTEANDAYIQMTRRVYLSDSVAKDMLFEDWTEKDFQMLMAYTEEVSQLQNRNAEIGVEYRTATSDNVKIPLYVEFVQNNNRIAEIYGYANYYAYAYEMVYDRDYGADSLSQMRQFAKESLTVIFQNALANFEASFGSLTPRSQSSVVSFLYDDYNAGSKNYVQLYMDGVGGSLAEHMQTMLEHDSLFTTNRNAMEGAFTTAIGDRSYCFFGPGYASASTVIHEGGHYYASRYADLNSIALDLAETHSQANEWLFIRYLADHMGQSQYNAVVDYRLYENVAMIMICLMVDEFEEMVYTTDVSNFTAADFDAIMDTVSRKYFPNGDADTQLADMGSYWRQVVVDQPVYYVSYAVSSIAAIGIYTAATEDFDAALETYRKLCEEPLEDEGFLTNITAAGLLGPFDEAFYQKLSDLVQARGK